MGASVAFGGADGLDVVETRPVVTAVAPRVLMLVSELEDYALSLAGGISRHVPVCLGVPRRRYARLVEWCAPTVDLRLLEWPRHRSPANPLFLARLAWLVRDTRPDVIHLLSNNTLWLNLLAPLWRGRPLLTTVHDVARHPGDLETATLPVWATDLMARQSSDLVVHGEALRRQAIERFGKTADRVHVLSHPALPRYADLARREGLTRRSDRFTVLLFGRLYAYKGLELLIRAEARLSASRQIAVVIAGRGDDPARFADAMGDPARYDIRHGFVPDREVAQAFLDADVVLLPYTEASQSGVLHIAGTFGKPVLATDLGDLGATVRAHRLGLVVPPDDPDALALGIERFAADPAFAARLGENGLAWARGGNAPVSVGGEAARLYGRIVARERAR